jgi:glycosyltransferase involved in cell wall biosynthesis
MDDGKEGRFWDLNDPAKAASSVIELLDNELERQAMAAAARDRFSREFSTDVVVPRLLSFLLGTTPPDAPWLVSAGSTSFAKPFVMDPRVR